MLHILYYAGAAKRSFLKGRVHVPLAWFISAPTQGSISCELLRIPVPWQEHDSCRAVSGRPDDPNNGISVLTPKVSANRELSLMIKLRFNRSLRNVRKNYTYCTAKWNAKKAKKWALGRPGNLTTIWKLPLTPRTKLLFAIFRYQIVPHPSLTPRTETAWSTRGLMRPHSSCLRSSGRPREPNGSPPHRTSQRYIFFQIFRPLWTMIKTHIFGE